MSSTFGGRLGKYDLQAELGRGGMGIVYRGYDAALRRPVAIKVLPPQLTYDAQFVQRFQQEAILAANLRHPNIVTIYDVGKEADVYYIVMEYLEGVTLETLLARQGPMPFDQSFHILRQVADALDAAHSRGIIHRDVKPANIMISPEGRATLMDFGLVRAAEGTSLTRSGVYMGTPEYMAPEQALGESVGPAGDIYSLGIVLYKMLCGKVPFSRSTPLGVTYAHVNEPPPPLRTIRADVPLTVEAVVNKALAKKPVARYQTANALTEDYRVAIAGALPGALHTPSPTLPKTESPLGNQKTVLIEKPARATRRVPIALFGIVATLALIGLVILTQMLRPGQSGAKSAQVTTPAAQSDSIATSTLAPIRPGAPSATAKPGSSGGTPAPTSTMQPIAPNATASTARPPSPQPNPAAIPTPAPPTAERARPQVRVTSDSANLRNGPGTSYSIVGQAKQGDALPISARSADGGWWQICCVNGQSAWVSTQVVAVEGDTSGVQVARDVPPSPIAPSQPSPSAQCKPWHIKPKPGYGIIMIENHLGEELSADYAVGGTGHWMIAAKKGDEPGRWWKEVPIGDHVINYSTPFGYGRTAFRVENGRSYVSPLWYNDRADDYVFPMEIPAGCQ